MDKAIETSLFKRLFRYHPRENRLPEEDFFTEAFVGVMEREPELLKALFKQLTGFEVEDVNISSQIAYPSVKKDGTRHTKSKGLRIKSGKRKKNYTI